MTSLAPTALPTIHETIRYDADGCRSSLYFAYVSFICLGTVLFVSMMDICGLCVDQIDVKRPDYDRTAQRKRKRRTQYTEENFDRLMDRRELEMRRLRRMNTFAGLYIPSNFSFAYKCVVVAPRFIMLIVYPTVLFFFDFQCSTYAEYSTIQSSEPVNFFDKKSISKVAGFIPCVIFLLWHLLGPVRFWNDTMLLQLDHSADLVKEQIEFYKQLKAYRWIVGFFFFWIFAITVANGFGTYYYAKHCREMSLGSFSWAFKSCDADFDEIAARHLAIFELARCGNYTFVFVMLCVVFFHLKAYHLLVSMFMIDVSIILSKAVDDTEKKTFDPGEVGLTLDSEGIVRHVKEDSVAAIMDVELGWQIMYVGQKPWSSNLDLTEFMEGDSPYVVVFDTDLTRDPTTLIEQVKASVEHWQSFVYYFFLLIKFLLGGLIACTVSVTYENSTVTLLMITSTALALGSILLVIPILITRAMAQNSHHDVKRLQNMALWCVLLAFVCATFFLEDIQAFFQMMTGGLLMVSIFLYFLISTGILSVQSIVNIFTQLQEQPDQAILGVVDILVPSNRKSIVKKGYLKTKTLSGQITQAYQQKSIALATEALAGTKDLVDSYNTIVEEMVESMRDSRYYTQMRGYLSRIQAIGRQANMLGNVVQQSINTLLLDQNEIDFEEVKALMLNQISRVEAIFNDPSTLNDPKVIGGILDDFDVLLELLDNCGLECTRVQMSLRTCRETYESLAGDGSLHNSNFLETVKQVAERQVEKQMNKIFEECNIPEHEREIVQECTVKIIEYAKCGQIPAEELEELRRIAGDYLGDDFASAMKSVDSLETFLHAMAHTFLKDRARLIHLTETRFLSLLDKLMQKYFIPQAQRQDVLNIAQKILDTVKSGQLPEESLDELCNLLQQYAGDKFDPNDVHFLFSFTTSMLSSLGSRGMEIQVDQLMPLIHRIMEKYNLTEKQRQKIEPYAMKLCEAIAEGKPPQADLDEICNLLAMCAGDKLDQNDLTLIKTFVSALVTTFNTQSAEPEQLRELLEGIMKKYALEDAQQKEIMKYTDRILEAVQMEMFPEVEIDEMIDLFKEFAGSKLDPSDMEVVTSMAKFLVSSLRNRELAIEPDQFIPLINRIALKYELPESQHEEIQTYAKKILKAVKGREMPQMDLDAMLKLIELGAGDKFDSADGERIKNFVSTVLVMIQSQKRASSTPKQLRFEVDYDPYLFYSLKSKRSPESAKAELGEPLLDKGDHASLPLDVLSSSLDALD